MKCTYGPNDNKWRPITISITFESETEWKEFKCALVDAGLFSSTQEIISTMSDIEDASFRY
jgi:hypothetical protein